MKTNEQIRVNVTTSVNTATIRRERRNGRDIIVVPSATLPDNIVMNGIRYPADEIEKSYKSLERSPAPLGHPNVEGAFVSASDPEGLVRGWIGAWNENVRRENGRVFLDKIIDVEYANMTEGGKTVIEAIDKGEPVHTSTGLYGIPVATVNDADAEFAMTDMVFDHDAILIGEEGAATPSQGVGMLVNAKTKDGRKVEVVNSALDMADNDVDWAGMHLLDSLGRLEKAGRWEKIKSALLGLLGTTETQTNEDSTAMDKSQYDEMTGKLDKLATSFEGLGETIGTAVANAVKPVADAVEAMQTAENAKKEAEKTKLVEKIVAANMMTKETAEGLTVEALTELTANLGTRRSAAPIHGNAGGGNDGGSVFKLPAAKGK